MILRLFEQDVQISGTKTGSLVSATLKNHAAARESPSVFFGDTISGAVFFWVLFFSLHKEMHLAVESETKTKKEHRCLLIDWILACASMTIEVLDSRVHGNDERCAE